jgi:hypothetical protein
MKITIEFNLPEEQHEFECATKAVKMQSALMTFDRHIRSQIKYAPDSMSNETLTALRAVQHNFNLLTEGLIHE